LCLTTEVLGDEPRRTAGLSGALNRRTISRLAVTLAGQASRKKSGGLVTTSNPQATENPTAQIFHYEKPDFPSSRRKAVRNLGRTDIAFVALQIIRKGGENNLHSHPHVDGFWTVLKGRVKFYTTDDVLVADLGPLEGIVIPRNYPYWFESSGDEDLEILQFEASDVPLGSAPGRVDLAPQKENFHDVDWGEGGREGDRP
jgi:mannose-6-phosphate isomerase-like protein (cupin superfamily)